MSEPSRTETQALVVGAGPVGLMMASELTRHGVACRVIDQDEGPTDQSRALGVQPRTLEVFEDVGVLGPVLARGRRLRGMSAYDGGHRIVHLCLDLEEMDTAYPFVLILPQSETEHILVEHLAGQGIAVARRTRLVDFVQDDDGVTATLADADGGAHSVRSRWLIGCDGARSVVRHQLGLTFEGAEYEERFLLADVAVDWEMPGDEMHALLTPLGPIAAFPFNIPGRWRLIDATGVVETDDPAQVVARFQSLLSENGYPDAVVRDPSWVSSFRIHRRAVDRFRVDRCFVAGDAAHIHSPAGGQGMNTGIQDAYNLAWKLGLVHAGASPDALLDSYSAERRPVAADVLSGSDLATRIMTLRNPVAESIRNHLASILGEFDFVRRRLSRGVSELGVGYPDSPIVAEDRAPLLQALWPVGQGPGLSAALDFGSAPQPGDRAPDVLLAADGEAAPGRLFEVLRGTRHTLLLFEGFARPEESHAQAEAVGALVRRRYAAWIVPYLITCSSVRPEGFVWEGATLLDFEGTLHNRYGAGAECLYLIRPDGYVGYRSQPADAEKLDAYLGRLFS